MQYNTVQCAQYVSNGRLISNESIRKMETVY